MSSNLGEDHAKDGEEGLKREDGGGPHANDRDETIHQLEATNDSPSRSPSRSPLSQILHEEDLFREDATTEGDATGLRGEAFRKFQEARPVDQDEESTSTADTPKAQLYRPETPSTPDDTPSRRVSFISLASTCLY